MPVHAAGPRLYRSVPFKHLVRGAGAGGSRASNIALNLTPFVDMMTILVTFLLMVFSASGELLHPQKNLDLPMADDKATLQEAPVIVVTKSEIVYQGLLVATTDSVLRDDSPSFKVEALFERLDAAAKKIHDDVVLRKFPRKLMAACDAAARGVRPERGQPICPEGLAILQADQQTDARLINKIVNTCKAAGFDNILFAVKNKK